MNKQNRVLAVVLLVQVLLLLGMKLGGQDDAAQSKAQKVFETLDPAKVTRLEIYGEPKEATDDKAPAQSSVKLAKDGTQWGIATAEGYPADNQKVEDFLGKLAKLKTRGPVLTKATYHKKVEVADDKYQRKIVLTVDGKDVTFFLGTSPSFKNVHLRKAGSDEVLQVGELTAWEAGARAWDWVDRSYVKFPDANVYGVHIQNKSGTINLKRTADGVWSADGLAGPAKKSAIDELVRKASAINLEEPVGKTEKPEHGLGAPLATITLTTGTSTIAGKMPDEMKTDVVRIGAKNEASNRYYAKSTTSPYVVELASWAVEPLINKGLKDLVEEEKKAEPAKTAPAPAAPKKK